MGSLDVTEENFVVKLKKKDDSLGFSLLKAAGFSHVIYEINDNIVYESPASSQVESGDVIVKVNGTDVHHHSTKEVLKCLRLSSEPITLELKRDPKIKDLVRTYMTSNDKSPSFIPQKTSSSPTHLPIPVENSQTNKTHKTSSSDASVIRKSRIPINNSRTMSKSAPQSPQSNKVRSQSQIPYLNGGTSTNNQNQNQQANQPNNKARFEAYMMTGDLILNLSRTPQVSGIHSNSKVQKLDSLRDKIGTAPQAKYDSSPSSSSPSFSEDSTEEFISKSLKNKGEGVGKKNQNSGKSLEQEYREILNNSSNNIRESNNHDDDIDGSKARNFSIKLCESQSSSSNSSPNYNSNSKNEKEELRKLIDNEETNSVNCKSQHEIFTQQNYSLLSDNYQAKSQLTPSASVSSTSTTSSASTTINRSETLNTPTLDVSYSMPTSPTSLTTPLLVNVAKRKELACSVPTSPESGPQELIKRSQSNNHQPKGSSMIKKCDASGFRTSRSEDHLQNSQREGLGAIVPIDIDEDVNSSLNTLLDTRQDSEESQNSDRDRIVWTYNAPVPTTAGMTVGINPVTSPISHSSSLSTSPQHTYSPASPTSVSSSVMSSSGSKGNGSSACATNNGLQNILYQFNNNGDHSISEALSNISSPDYQDEHDLLSVRELVTMAISDASDSDSTLLVSDTSQFIHDNNNDTNKLVIQVKGNSTKANQNNNTKKSVTEPKDVETEVGSMSINEYTAERVKNSSSPVSDDGSDVESLHSFHYSPKAVDIPSAVRLAKRLYYLDGFKKSDVSRHLSKNNEFSRVVADEFLKFFFFETMTLDEALRNFLKQFSLSGETQERERVLIHFSKRFLECNPGSFDSQDAIHTLTCAIMLLNTDLHGQNLGRKMTCAEFIENLSELNDGENFPKETLKQLYQAIKGQPLEWAIDDVSPEQPTPEEGALVGPGVGSNPFLDMPQNIAAIEYKKGYVMRKCCYDTNNKKTPFGKRSWKMFYCTLRDLVLYLHKDERGFHKNQLSDNVHNAIRIHHSLASKATDYTKKQHVFRLQTADQCEYLFQTSDSKEVFSWIDVINFVAASFSAPPLEGGVGSQKRFQRPLLPCSQTKLLLREQLASHEGQVNKLTATLNEHRSETMPTKGLALQNYREKESYLQYELKRYKTYAYLLNSHLNSNNPNDMINIITNNSLENDEKEDDFKIKQQQQIQHGFTPIPFNATGNANVQVSNRYSYRAAIYQSEDQQDVE